MQPTNSTALYCRRRFVRNAVGELLAAMRQIGLLAREVTRYSSGHSEGLSRVRGCFVIRLPERQEYDSPKGDSLLAAN